MLDRMSYWFAVAGSAVLHGGLAVWVMTSPSPPVAIPQQQVIHIAMITPSTLKETVKAETAAKVPVVPPKPNGMKQPKPKPPQEAKREKAEAKPQQLAKLAPASGPQAAKAVATQAALSEPLYNAAYLRNTPPAYPAAARRKKIEGKVLLDVAVSREGIAEAVEVVRSSGSDLLDAAARRAVERWRFIPARRGSEKIAARVTVPIIFRIGE